MLFNREKARPVIAANFKRLREHCMKTQQEVADFLDVDRRTIMHYESGKTIPDYASIAALTGYFDCALDDFMCTPWEATIHGNDDVSFRSVVYAADIIKATEAFRKMCQTHGFKGYKLLNI